MWKKELRGYYRRDALNSDLKSADGKFTPKVEEWINKMIGKAKDGVWDIPVHWRQHWAKSESLKQFLDGLMSNGATAYMRQRRYKKANRDIIRRRDNSNISAVNIGLHHLVNFFFTRR